MSDNLATRPSWTEDQKQTVHSIRRAMRDFVSPLSPPVPIERLTELPDGSVVPDNLDALAAIAQPATNIPAELVQATNIKASQVVYWTFRLKGTTRKAERIIFYLHGGGNTTNSPVSPTYLPRFAQVLQKAGSETIIIAPAYRLATSPENAFPAAHQDVFTVWQEVVESHAYQGTDIILAGDSSGGNLGEFPLLCALPRHVEVCRPSNVTATCLLLPPASSRLGTAFDTKRPCSAQKNRLIRSCRRFYTRSGSRSNQM